MAEGVIGFGETSPEEEEEEKVCASERERASERVRVLFLHCWASE